MTNIFIDIPILGEKNMEKKKKKRKRKLEGMKPQPTISLPAHTLTYEHAHEAVFSMALPGSAASLSLHDSFPFFSCWTLRLQG
jgi:hypothetical protein